MHSCPNTLELISSAAATTKIRIRFLPGTDGCLAPCSPSLEPIMGL
jgi:hypothetical protein